MWHCLQQALKSDLMNKKANGAAQSQTQSPSGHRQRGEVLGRAVLRLLAVQLHVQIFKIPTWLQIRLAVQR